MKMFNKYARLAEAGSGGINVDNNKSEEFRYVSKEEFIEFLRSYPYPLERDFYMDWWSWNDFRDGRKWPESMAAMTDDYGEESEHKIRDCYIK